LDTESPIWARRSQEGMMAAMEQLDEQITTIVIIEDNPHDSRLIRRLLHNYKHYRIYETHSGLDGLDLVRQRRPDLVILDLTLPDRDGFSILEELKTEERTRDIPVVIISAKSLNNGEWQYLHRYTESIWQKGNFNPREVINHVVGVLGDEGSPPGTSSSTPFYPAEKGSFTGEDLLADAFGQSQRPRILVIDDNTWDARLMRRLLEARQRFEVVEAHSGAEALAAVERATPDLIILDLVLPDTGGENLLKTLRARNATCQVPVIVLSAKDIEPPLRAQLTMLADSVWSKGMLDRSSLLAHIETILPE
jgi:CheY-like chemotaxis protein